MTHRLAFTKHYLHFSCWSKKGYAVFAGLGREVKISRLALHMYKNVLLKAIGNGVIVNFDRVAEVVPMIVLAVKECWTNARSKGEVCPIATQDSMG